MNNFFLKKTKFLTIATLSSTLVLNAQSSFAAQERFEARAHQSVADANIAQQLQSMFNDTNDAFYRMQSIYQGSTAFGESGYDRVNWLNKNINSFNFEKKISQRIARELGYYGGGFFEKMDLFEYKDMMALFVEQFIDINNNPEDPLFYNGYIFKNLVSDKITTKEVKYHFSAILSEKGFNPDAVNWLSKNFFANKDATLSMDLESDLIYGSLSWWQLYTATKMIHAAGLHPENYDEEALLRYYHTVVSESNPEDDPTAQNVLSESMTVLADAYGVIDLFNYDPEDESTIQRMTKFISLIANDPQEYIERLKVINKPIERRYDMIRRIRIQNGFDPEECPYSHGSFGASAKPAKFCDLTPEESNSSEYEANYNSIKENKINATSEILLNHILKKLIFDYKMSYDEATSLITSSEYPIYVPRLGKQPGWYTAKISRHSTYYPYTSYDYKDTEQRGWDYDKEGLAHGGMTIIIPMHDSYYALSFTWNEDIAIQEIDLLSDIDVSNMTDYQKRERAELNFISYSQSNMNLFFLSTNMEKAEDSIPYEKNYSFKDSNRVRNSDKVNHLHRHQKGGVNYYSIKTALDNLLHKHYDYLYNHYYYHQTAHERYMYGLLEKVVPFVALHRSIKEKDVPGIILNGIFDAMMIIPIGTQAARFAVSGMRQTLRSASRAAIKSSLRRKMSKAVNRVTSKNLKVNAAEALKGLNRPSQELYKMMVVIGQELDPFGIGMVHSITSLASKTFRLGKKGLKRIAKKMKDEINLPICPKTFSGRSRRSISNSNSACFADVSQYFASQKKHKSTLDLASDLEKIANKKLSRKDFERSESNWTLSELAMDSSHKIDADDPQSIYKTYRDLDGRDIDIVQLKSYAYMPYNAGDVKNGVFFPSNPHTGKSFGRGLRLNGDQVQDLKYSFLPSQAVTDERYFTPLHHGLLPDQLPTVRKYNNADNFYAVQINGQYYGVVPDSQHRFSSAPEYIGSKSQFFLAASPLQKSDKWLVTYNRFDKTWVIKEASPRVSPTLITQNHQGGLTAFDFPLPGGTFTDRHVDALTSNNPVYGPRNNPDLNKAGSEHWTQAGSEQGKVWSDSQSRHTQVTYLEEISSGSSTTSTQSSSMHSTQSSNTNTSSSMHSTQSSNTDTSSSMHSTQSSNTDTSSWAGDDSFGDNIYHGKSQHHTHVEDDLNRTDSDAGGTSVDSEEDLFERGSGDASSTGHSSGDASSIRNHDETYHAIQRHIRITDEDLLKRLKEEDIGFASRFSTENEPGYIHLSREAQIEVDTHTAKEAIKSALTANHTEIDGYFDLTNRFFHSIPEEHLERAQKFRSDMVKFRNDYEKYKVTAKLNKLRKRLVKENKSPEEIRAKMKSASRTLYTTLNHEVKLKKFDLLNKHRLTGLNLGEELIDRGALNRLVIHHDLGHSIGHGFNASGERVDNLTHVTLVFEYSAGNNFRELQGNRLRLITAYPSLPPEMDDLYFTPNSK